MDEERTEVMDQQTIIRKLMKLKGYNLQIIADKCGFKYRSNISEMLRSRHMRVDNLIRILEAMDCELVIRSRTRIPARDDPERMYRPEYVVELKEE